ncbi:hypothetical protein AK88_03624 [Plasmodium fragile]|uniref:Uncharacterized protein n=1 Tax=Plasmodium fragile TaxID=5857 RepID=A0A0D9QIU6_PLAFR|nr:uncharacterized protein AK88_03624 [Plasmodium fragile]KJP86712.1 hypothetical protein AK88_03624 [Plasmodium fragile]
MLEFATILIESEDINMLNIVIGYILLFITSIWTIDGLNVADCTQDCVWEKKFEVQDESNAGTNTSLTENDGTYDEGNDWSYSNSSSKTKKSKKCAKRQNGKKFLNSRVDGTPYSPASNKYNYFIYPGRSYHSCQNIDNNSRYSDAHIASREKPKRQNAGNPNRRKLGSANSRNSKSANGRKIENPYRQHVREPPIERFAQLPLQYSLGPSYPYFRRTDHHYFGNPHDINLGRKNLPYVDYDDAKSSSTSHRSYEDIRRVPIEDDDDDSESSSSDEDNLSIYSMNDSLCSHPRNPYKNKGHSGHHGPYGRDDHSVYSDTYNPHSLKGTKYVSSEHGSHNALEDNDVKKETELPLPDEHYRLPFKKGHHPYKDSECVVSEQDNNNDESYDFTIMPHFKKCCCVNKRIKHYIKKYNGKLAKQLPFLGTASFIGSIVFSFLVENIALPVIFSILSFIFTSYYIKRLKMKRKKKKRLRSEYYMKR